jgi:hypothetical protein
VFSWEGARRRSRSISATARHHHYTAPAARGELEYGPDQAERRGLAGEAGDHLHSPPDLDEAAVEQVGAADPLAVEGGKRRWQARASRSRSITAIAGRVGAPVVGCEREQPRPRVCGGGRLVEDQSLPDRRMPTWSVRWIPSTRASASSTVGHGAPLSNGDLPAIQSGAVSPLPPFAIGAAHFQHRPRPAPRPEGFPRPRLSGPVRRLSIRIHRLRGFHHWFTSDYADPPCLPRTRDPDGSHAPRRCQGCSRPHLPLRDQAAPRFTRPLRQPGGGVLHPLNRQRLVAHDLVEEAVDEVCSSMRLPHQAR